MERNNQSLEQNDPDLVRTGDGAKCPTFSPYSSAHPLTSPLLNDFTLSLTFEFDLQCACFLFAGLCLLWT
jgi:hypothetical protein